jgi:hypothetical protein
MTSSQSMPRAMASGHRHHPYASASSSASTSRAAPSQSNRKWSTVPAGAEVARGRSSERGVAQSLPSPPRSHRDISATPPAGLGAAFGGREGGKWWDEELVSHHSYVVDKCLWPASTSCQPVINSILLPGFRRRRPGPAPCYSWRKEG